MTTSALATRRLINPYRVVHVRQRGDHDCAIACLATLTERSYEAAEHLVRTLPRIRWANGMSRKTLDGLLSQLGYAVSRRWGIHEPFGGVHLCEVQSAAQVARREWHFVVLLEDGTVLDPALPHRLPPLNGNALTAYDHVRCVAGVTKLW